MTTNRLRRSLFAGAAGLVLINTVQANTPVWTFMPISGYPPSVTVSTSGMATIKYTVTNQSRKPHILRMKPIQGITSSGCSSSLDHNKSCILTLAVNGSSLKGDVFGGPVLCDRDNSNQCYPPSQVNGLAVRLTQPSPIQQYTITSSAGSNGSVNPNGTQTVNSGTTLTFTAISNGSYGVGQWLVDGVLAQFGGSTYLLANISANHSVNVTFGTVTLTPRVSTLGLSVNCPATSTSPRCAKKNAALTGTPRTIIIKNTGSANATNVLVSTYGLPSDTVVSPLSCGTIAANGGECTITVTPGATASSNASNVLCTTGVQPEGSVQVTADGGLLTSIKTYVLSYGCIYQGGFIYSVNDTTPNTSSIGGKTAAVTDTFPGQDSPGIATPDWGGYGTDIGSALYYNNPQGANNGSANSVAIISALTTHYSSPPYNGSSPVPLSNYAAGLCSFVSVNTAGASSCIAPTPCYTNWYLPAICELGPFTLQCTTGSTNIQQQLYNNTLIPKTTLGFVDDGFYWSSTADPYDPQFSAWAGYFSSNSALLQDNKNSQFGVRCSRALTF